jgi:hypothetical protein
MNTPNPIKFPPTGYSMVPTKWKRPIPNSGEEKPSGSITGAIIVAAGLASVAAACVGCACCCCCVRRRRQMNVAFADTDVKDVVKKMFASELTSDSDTSRANKLNNVV